MEPFLQENVLFKSSSLPFSQKPEHILLVGLDSFLVKGIDSIYEAGDVAGELEEIEEGTEGLFIKGIDFHLKARKSPGMGGESCILSSLVDIPKILTVKIAETISHIIVMKTVGVILLSYGKECFEDYSSSILYKLSQGMEIFRVSHIHWKKSLSILSFRFTKELLPPFCKAEESWLKIAKKFNALSHFI